jgi:hypothetical protein
MSNEVGRVKSDSVSFLGTRGNPGTDGTYSVSFIFMGRLVAPFHILPLLKQFTNTQ